MDWPAPSLAVRRVPLPASLDRPTLMGRHSTWVGQSNDAVLVSLGSWTFTSRADHNLGVGLPYIVQADGTLQAHPSVTGLVRPGRTLHGTSCRRCVVINQGMLARTWLCHYSSISSPPYFGCSPRRSRRTGSQKIAIACRFKP